MTQKSYAFYLKTDTGHRGSELVDIISLEVTLRWNNITKWTITGASLTPCPMTKNSEIIVYRGNEAWLSGYVTEIEDTYTAKTGIYDWTVDGYDDLGKLERRVIYPDPSNADVQYGDDIAYTAEGNIGNILLEMIRRNIANSADLEDRRIKTLSVKNEEATGDELTITKKYDELFETVIDELKDGTLGIRSVWDGVTGISEIQIYYPEDVSNTVVFSVEAGSLSAWSRKRTAPKANVIIATGCELTEEVTDEETGKTETKPTGEYQTVIISDEKSVAEWGRYEKFVQHSDIKPIEEKDEETGEVISVEPWDSVFERLKQAVMKDLIEGSAVEGYELTTVDLEHMQYGVHWNLGDIVKVRVGTTEFTAPIEEIKVKYSGGIETITPSVGQLQKGELQTVFDELGALKKQISILEKSNIINDELDNLGDELVAWALEYEDEDEGGEEEPTIEIVAAQVSQIHKMIGRLCHNIIDVWQ